MKKTVKTFSLIAALTLAIPLSVSASATQQSQQSQQSATNAAHPHFRSDDGGGQGGRVHARGSFISQEVLDLLKLDKQSLADKLKAGKTLAQIAAEQGVSRDDLKKTMTDSFDKRLEEKKKMFNDHLDKLIDSKIQPGKMSDGSKRMIKPMISLESAASVLGMSGGDLKKQLVSGKTLADLAKEKGIDVQKVIDAEKQSIIDGLNQAVKDGKMTQQQADEQIANAGPIAENIVNGNRFAGPGGHAHRKFAETSDGADAHNHSNANGSTAP
jgi:hypothetical protein